MLTAKEIFNGKMQSVMAKDLNPGDFVFYIGKWATNKVNAFVESREIVMNDDKVSISKVKVRLDSGELCSLLPEDHVICCQDKAVAA